MKTEIRQDGEAIVVTIEGRLDYQSNEPLRKDLHRIVAKAKTDAAAKKVIFDCRKLEFIGSSGISSFVQTLKEFNATAPEWLGEKPRYAAVRSEFQKVIRAMDGQDFEFFDSEESARKGVKMPSA